MHSIDHIKDRAQGQWPTILVGMGAPSSCLVNKHGPCPFGCGGRESFRFDDKNGSGSFICTHCGSGTGTTFASKLLGLEDSKDLPKVVEAVGKVLGIQPEQDREEVFRREYRRTGNVTDAYRKAFGDHESSKQAVYGKANRLANRLGLNKPAPVNGQ
ncbi:MAG: hypothetical protein HQL90_11355, partial [Magnetococcales bacterium]|nr:hypothetical protein [Magnetococcales bacterium]